ncbi:MAG: PorP/SprF family type IX secretion system membrane protein [Bacteroidales bacterium]|nr:PorP/SprF family type IX secretion system membrane protein [Bacteroidales bacterium]
MKKTFLFAIFFSLAAGVAEAQEYCFSQYYLDKLSVNPAFSAVGDYSEVGVIFRDQWPGIEGGYKIYNLEYQQKLPSYDSGLGLRFFGNTGGGGAFKVNEFALGYAYTFALNYKLKCSLGLQGAYYMQSFNPSGLVYYSMIDPASGEVSPLNEDIPFEKTGCLNFSGGVIFYTKNTVVSAAMYRFTSMTLSGEKTAMPLMITGLVNHKIKLSSHAKGGKIEDVFVVPTINFSHSANADMIMPGVYFYGKMLLAGLSFRYQKTDFQSSAVVTSIGFRVGKTEIGFGYDFYTGAVGTPSKNSLEAGVKYKFENSEKNNGSKTILCPAF